MLPVGPPDGPEPSPMTRVGQRMNHQELQLIIRHQAMQLQINDPVSSFRAHADADLARPLWLSFVQSTALFMYWTFTMNGPSR